MNDTEQREPTLREHLLKAAQARWIDKTVEEKKAHAQLMARARWTKYRKTNEKLSTGEKGPST